MTERENQSIGHLLNPAIGANALYQVKTVKETSGCGKKCSCPEKRQMTCSNDMSTGTNS